MTKSPSSYLQRAGDSYIKAVARYIARAEDEPEIQVQKGLLVGATFIVLPATIIWGTAYLYYGELWAAFITYGYMLLSVGGLLHLHRTGRQEPLAGIQIICTLFLPFALDLILGGIVSSSAIVLAMIMSPIGILMYAPVWNATRAFVGYVVLFALAALLDPLVRGSNGLPGWLILTLFVLNIAILSAIIFFMTRTYIQQRDLLTKLLRLEQEKSDRLLLNVLPAPIAAILKEEDRTIADRFATVSILFADIVDSTPFSEERDPVEVVNVLNDAFSYFDSVVKKYELEKVRSLGDNYMIVSGAPVPRIDHAHVLARAALELRDFQNFFTLSQARELRMRFGINCGPVIAGVIGRMKFQYDVWGDSVNVASRMESHGVPGKIQITRQFYELIQDDFICEPRGQIQVKGKGLMETWFLIGEKKEG